MIDVKKLRMKLDLTQEELAREMSVTTLTIRRWEKERRKPHLIHRLQLKALELKAENK